MIRYESKSFSFFGGRSESGRKRSKTPTLIVAALLSAGALMAAGPLTSANAADTSGSAVASPQTTVLISFTDFPTKTTADVTATFGAHVVNKKVEVDEYGYVVTLIDIPAGYQGPASVVATSGNQTKSRTISVNGAKAPEPSTKPSTGETPGSTPTKAPELADIPAVAPTDPNSSPTGTKTSTGEAAKSTAPASDSATSNSTPSNSTTSNPTASKSGAPSSATPAKAAVTEVQAWEVTLDGFGFAKNIPVKVQGIFGDKTVDATFTSGSDGKFRGTIPVPLGFLGDAKVTAKGGSLVLTRSLKVTANGIEFLDNGTVTSTPASPALEPTIAETQVLADVVTAPTSTSETLAVTGSSTYFTAAIGFLLLATGLGMQLLARRRQMA